MWQGTNKALDVINDNTDNKLQLATSGAYSGQYWRFTDIGGGAYRLTCLWKGLGKSIGVLNDSQKRLLRLQDSILDDTQTWVLSNMPNGYYRLNSKLVPKKALDIINDNVDKTPQMAARGNYSGQYWKLTKIRKV